MIKAMVEMTLSTDMFSNEHKTQLNELNNEEKHHKSQEVSSIVLELNRKIY